MNAQIPETLQMLAPQAIAVHAAARPDEPLLQHVDGSAMTWGEVHDAALRWADALEKVGVSPGEPVVSMFPNGFEAALSWLGCAWLRAIEAPLNTSYRGSWLVHAVNLTGARVALIHSRFLPALLDVASELTQLELVVTFGDEDAIALETVLELTSAADFLAGAEATPRDGPEVWDVAALIFTSGTTGASKAVMVPWGQFQAIRQIGWGLPPGPRVQYSPFQPYHVTGKGPIFSAATDGGRVVLRESWSTPDFWDEVRRFGCTSMVIMGPMAYFLLDQPERDDDADHPLEFVLMGPVIPEVDEFQRRFGIEVQTCFNMTEINAPVISLGRPINAETHRSCGRVRDGVEVRIVDEHDIEVPPNTPGEMIVRSEPWTLNLGYWGMPDKTLEAWRNGWFHTGDTFTYDEDGFFYFHDRAKDYIRRRGENISSFEVEACVNGHPAIIESAAVAVDSEEGEDEVKVAVVLAAGHSLEPADLIEFLVPQMPRFAVPRYVDIVDALPKTQATQRVQKAEVRAAGVTPTTWDRLAVVDC